MLAEVFDVGSKKRTFLEKGVYIKNIDLCTFTQGYAQNMAASAQWLCFVVPSCWAFGEDLLSYLNGIAAQLGVGIYLQGEFIITTEYAGVVSITQNPTDLAEGTPSLLPYQVYGEMTGQDSQLVPPLAR